MRRRLNAGGALAVLASFLFAVLGEHSSAHVCPLHHGAGTDAEPSSHAQHRHGASEPSGDDAPTGPCTCVGLCHGSASAPVVGAAAAALLSGAGLALAARRAPAEPLLPPRSAWLVPWPNGPPTA